MGYWIPRPEQPPTTLEYAIAIILIIILTIIAIGQLSSLYKIPEEKPKIKSPRKYKHPGIHPDIDMRL